MSKILAAFMISQVAIMFLMFAPTAKPVTPGAYNMPTAQQMEINRVAYAASAKHIEGEKYLATTRTLVTAMLREPASGRFGVTFHGRGKSVCGTINARNGFGGMTGQKAFVRVGNALPMFEDTWNEAFVNAWNRHCANMGS